MNFSSENSSIDKKTANSWSGSQATARTATTEQKGHKLELDHNRAMSMTGVVDVPVFTDKNITVRLNGETLLVVGQGLAVKNLDIENGKLQVTASEAAGCQTWSSRFVSGGAVRPVSRAVYRDEDGYGPVYQ